jgi:hypothetical protein
MLTLSRKVDECKPLIRGAERENEFQTWVLRGVGFAMMMIGEAALRSFPGYLKWRSPILEN